MSRRRQVPLDKLAALSGLTAIQLGPVGLSRGWVLLPISPGLKCFLARCILKTCVQKDESKGPEGFQHVSNARYPKAVNSKERVMRRCTTGRILVEFTFWTRPWQVAHHLFLGTEVNNIEQHLVGWAGCQGHDFGWTCMGCCRSYWRQDRAPRLSFDIKWLQLLHSSIQRMH